MLQNCNIDKRVVIDFGSAVTKAGFAGEESPHTVFPTVISHHDAALQTNCIGYDALLHESTAKIRRPIERGYTTNWSDMERIWHHTFYNELQVQPENHPVLLTEAIMNPKANREKITQAMFETFQVPALNIFMQTVLSLYASCRTTGLVVSAGEDVTHAIPYLDGFPLMHAVPRMDLAGAGLTKQMMRLLSYRSSDWELVAFIKEKYCYVAQDYNAELKQELPLHSFKLPDGNTVTIGNERFQCPEALFNPALIGIEHEGLHALVTDSVCRTDPDIRHLLYQNIVLAGGTTQFPGIAERLTSELNCLNPSFKIKTIAPLGRQYSSWLGGSLVASLSQPANIWITMDTYNEYGPSIIHRATCF